MASFGILFALARYIGLAEREAARPPAGPGEYQPEPLKLSRSGTLWLLAVMASLFYFSARRDAPGKAGTLATAQFCVVLLLYVGRAVLAGAREGASGPSGPDRRSPPS